MNLPKIAVLASGRGSDLQAIIDSIRTGKLSAQISVVISDNPEAKALKRAVQAGLEAVAIDRKLYATKREFEEKLVAVLRDYNVQWVILAGFMRILSPYMVNAYPHRIINIHPSLLPAFPGAHAHRDVLAYGVKVSGCTIHFVDEGMDSGPIIAQESIPVYPDDTEESLSQRVLAVEHRLYPEVISWLLANRVKIAGRQVKITDN